MYKYIGIALLSTMAVYSASALAENNSDELFKHSIGSEYREVHDPNLDKWREHELGILNEYTKYAQQQIGYVYASTKNFGKGKYNLYLDNENWWNFVHSSCAGIVNYDAGDDMPSFDKNLCEINMMRQRTYFIWTYFLHGSNTPLLARPNTKLSE